MSRRREGGLEHRPGPGRTWTTDVGAVLAYVEMVDPAPWGALVVERGGGLRLLDLEAGLVCLACPVEAPVWQVSVWRVSDDAPLARSGSQGRWLSVAHLPALARSMWRVARPDAVELFDLAAEVVLAERGDVPDVLLAVRPPDAQERAHVAPVPLGVPGGLVAGGFVLSRIVGAARVAAG